MSLARKKIWIINISVSFLIFILLTLFGTDLVVSLHNFLASIQLPLAGSKFTIIDVFLLSFIPVWSSFIYSKRKSVSPINIILTNLCILLSVIITCIITFMLCAKFASSPSPWLPPNIVYTPFYSFFWTMIFAIGISLPILFKGIFSHR